VASAGEAWVTESAMRPWQVVSEADAPQSSHDSTSSPASPWLNERLSPHGHAGAGTGLDERLGERRPLDERRAGLEAVGAVVAVQDGDRRPGDRALEVGLQQPVRHRLAVGGLDRLAEAALEQTLRGGAALLGPARLPPTVGAASARSTSLVHCETSRRWSATASDSCASSLTA